MKDIVDPIAEGLVKSSDTEDIIFARSDPFDNMMQLIFEQRITSEDIDNTVEAKCEPEEQKKIITYIANELVKYLSAKLTKSRLGSFRSAPKQAQEPAKKLSKSEQFIERKRKKSLEKEAKESKNKEGTVEKIGLKEIGQEIQEHQDKMAELDKKREDQQKSTEEEHKRHTGAYQIAFDLFASAVKLSNGEDQGVADLCDLIKKMGDVAITKRQVALDKMAGNPRCYLAIDALRAALKDKNILLQVINVLFKTGEKKVIVPLITVIKEYSTPNDILFRGPAERTIGEILRLMNEKAKSSGTKYLYQLSMNPKFEHMLRTMIRIVQRDIKDPKIRKEYFTPQCLKWISLIAEKLVVQKKKQVKVGFVKMSVHSDLSKELLEFVAAAK